MQIAKYTALVIVGVVVGLLLGGKVATESLGGVYSNVEKQFTSGIVYTESSRSITADVTLSPADSGKTFYVNTNFSTTTLPAATASKDVTYRFAVASAISTGDYRVVSLEGDNIEGSLMVAGAIVDCDDADRINLVTSVENLGDFFEIRSNGTDWFVTQSNALTAGALTCSG
jgi:hypothetical protein